MTKRTLFADFFFPDSLDFRNSSRFLQPIFREILPDFYNPFSQKLRSIIFTTILLYKTGPYCHWVTQLIIQLN
jgi:hypothetical protein